MSQFYKHKDVLKACNYYIQYEYDIKTKTGVITARLRKTITHVIKYDLENQIITSDFGNVSVYCPSYAALAFAECIVKKICKHYGYPYYWLFYDNLANNFSFYDEESNPKFENTNTLALELYNNGLNDSIISLAKENDIWPGIKSISEYLLGITLDTKD